MKRLPIQVSSLVAVAILSVAGLSHADSGSTDINSLFENGLPTRQRALENDTEYFVAPTTGLAKAVLDTVFIYGGPGNVQGKFQQLLANPGGTPDAQGWFGVDRTEVLTFWNISTFNAANFSGAGINNHAMWSGVPAGTPGFVSAPGYGNSWDDRLEFTEVVAGGVAHNARLQLEFNYDTEPAYDFFFVEYDSAGQWITLAQFDGSNDDGSGTFPTPAVFDQTVFIGAGDAGADGDEVRFRLRFLSDTAASDEDLFFDSIGGAVEVDNVRVTIDNAPVSFAQFEGDPDDGDWVLIQAPFAGDFAKIFSQFSEPDPCRSNISPQWGFLDNGQPINNGNGETTGGQTSVNWGYGIPGGWVTNYTGGISFGEVPLFNEIWSPEIDWDLPGTDDDLAQGGAFIRQSMWEHLPLPNGMFWIWSVRSFPDANGNWSGWTNRNVVFFEDLTRYSIIRNEVGDLIVNNPQKVQVALGVIDLASAFGLPGGDATPAPLYDDVVFARYRVGGPAITTARIERFNDSFTQSGATFGSAASLADLSIRLDAAQDIVRAQGAAIIAGDSTTVQVQAVLPGTTLAGPPVLKWVLDANPLFDSVRSLPAGSSVLTTFIGRDGRSWDRWQGSVLGQQSTNAAGAPVPGDFWFDMPDGRARTTVVGEFDETAMFFPGDVLRYFYEATDSDGNVTTAPAGFEDPAQLATFQDGTWGIIGRGFTVHGLPSMLDPDGDGTPEQPSVLLVNDFGRRGGENDFVSAFNQNGMFEGLDFDSYTVQRPDTGLSNGIGSAGAHGGTADQLRGYDTIVYVSGDLSQAMGDGSTAGDKSFDVQVLSQWHDLRGDRYAIYFGDYVASSLANGNTDAQVYLSNVLGVNVIDPDVRGEIGNQTAPVVAPTGPLSALFSTQFVAFGGCLGINEFDSIEELGIAVRTHEFLSPNGVSGAYPAAAGVWHEREVDDNGVMTRKIDVTFPFGLNVLWNTAQKAAPGASARAVLFTELFEAFGKTIDDSDATGSTAPRLHSKLLGNVPNPFNPSTSIKLRVGIPGRYSVKIYNLRGELVRTLADAEMLPGERSLTWDGTDSGGRVVSSGVYLSQFKGPDVNDTSKLMLVK